MRGHHSPVRQLNIDEIALVPSNYGAWNQR
jgi:hypothetical protein